MVRLLGAGGLEELDRVAGGIVEQDLPAARAADDVVAEVSPAARSRSTSPARSSTIRWMRFQPPGWGVRPSGIGRPAELAGPLSNRRRWPRTTSANAGAALERSSKPKWVV